VEKDYRRCLAGSYQGLRAVKIQPLRPLIVPAIVLVVFFLIAVLLPTFEPFDDAIIGLVQATPRSWEGAIILLTKIGDAPILILLALAVAAWELFKRHHVRSLVMAGSLIAFPSFYLVKETVQRARPLSEYVATHGLQGYSFPSGHSTGTMAVYGMIAFLAYSHLKGRARIAVVGACALIIIVVSFTRVYLGAHFPTDVFAGWLLAFVVISLLRSLSLYLAKRSPVPNSVAIEDTTEAPESIEKQ
jgi:undecaprenyl-diphosphatase